jgi:hypothetical protein
MTATTTLLEPSFFDLIAAIEQAPDLSEQRRRARCGKPPSGWIVQPR